MAYSMNQVALYLNLACSRVQADGDMRYLTGRSGTGTLTGGGQNQETQILFVRDALWIANNDDADSQLQKKILEKLRVGTPEALVEHVDAFQSRVFKRRRNGREEMFVPPASPAETLLFELAGLDDKGDAREVAYPDAMDLPTTGAGAPAGYSLGSGGKPPVSGILFVTGSYEGKDGTGDNEHAEQKLLAALSRVPDSIRGTLALYGCKRQCQVCADVFGEALPRLRASYRYVNCRAHDDTKVSNYAAQAHPSGIKALDVDRYFPA